MCKHCEDEYPETTVYDESVAFVANWLDGIEPDWFIKVNVSRLDMFDIHWCIFGQVFADKVGTSEFPHENHGYAIGNRLMDKSLYEESTPYMRGTLSTPEAAYAWTREILERY